MYCKLYIMLYATYMGGGGLISVYMIRVEESPNNHLSSEICSDHQGLGTSEQ